VEHRKIPRGLHHALSARDPATRRRMLYSLALVLLNVLYEDAGPPARSSGARRVFGKTQAYYASRLGLSMVRAKNGEVHGARHIRTLLKQLAHVGLIRKGGRCWFEGPGRHPRLVVWLQPWEESLPARYADALAALPSPSENADAATSSSSGDVRISRSGCFTDPTSQDRSVRGEMGSLRGREEAPLAPAIHQPASPASERPSAARSDRPSAGASEGGSSASSGPPDVELDPAAALATLGPAALRVLSGRPLGDVIQHVARTHRRAADTTHGRASVRRSATAAHDSREVPAAPPAQPAAPFPPRPHNHTTCPGGPQGVGCAACEAWRQLLFPGSQPTADAAPRQPHVRRSRSTSAMTPRSSADRRQPPQQSTIEPTRASWSPPRTTALSLEQAIASHVRWRRTAEADFPWRATVNGARWKLRSNGGSSPLTLVVDGRELGTISRWPERWLR
jgi:hypothetical protein